jgi:hypothetical protein
MGIRGAANAGFDRHRIGLANCRCIVAVATVEPSDFITLEIYPVAAANLRDMPRAMPPMQ